VALVVALKEAHDLDSVFIIPANRSPHKDNKVPQEAKHRLSMLKRAFRHLPYCKVLSLEVERAGPSFTIDTVEELKALNLLNPAIPCILYWAKIILPGLALGKM